MCRGGCWVGEGELGFIVYIFLYDLYEWSDMFISKMRQRSAAEFKTVLIS